MNDPACTPSRAARCQPLRYEPTQSEIDALIRAATDHPLGLDYLRDGSLDSVAVSFCTHAFTVIAARDRLARGES